MTDTNLLQMALVGYESERQRLHDKIAEIQRQLNGRSRRAATSAGNTPVKAARKGMSVAARKRIAAAQKKRWAEYRKKQNAA